MSRPPIALYASIAAFVLLLAGLGWGVYAMATAPPPPRGPYTLTVYASNVANANALVFISIDGYDVCELRPLEQDATRACEKVVSPADHEIRVHGTFPSGATFDNAVRRDAPRLFAEISEFGVTFAQG